MSKVEAIPKNMQIMKIVCCIRLLRYWIGFNSPFEAKVPAIDCMKSTLPAPVVTVTI
jgi:hypothetical protein